MDASELPAYLARIRDEVGHKAPPRVAYAMAREFHRQVTDVTLVRYSHKRGTRTTSPPGQPPALVGGHLKRSMRLYPARMTGAYSASSRVVPLVVYARIQELGGTVVAHGGALHWVTDGKGHFARSVTLPERPYMRPTHRRTVRDGSLRKAAVAEMRAVTGEVLGHG